LHIELLREVPEAMKPRRIAITKGSLLLKVTLLNLSSSPRPPAENVSMYSPEHVAMTELGRKDTFEVEKLLHPARSYTHPNEVVAEPGLSLNEKRAILASWASDVCAIETAPELRHEGDGPPVSFDDIMEALKLLDGEAHAHIDYGKLVNRVRRFRDLYRRGDNVSGGIFLS
jgi:hypothetical protein